ncbi:AbrB/MazE/SpoVT family DNA-binding domain-containing protein [Leptospira sp. GIMC2001]|uniref:AbrB/MazE/SpoVT family DNA-binding domain-containing protein n=1 Tax=Leptospira sp. GIMC2001 TaxID=1513297 RepID=UPI00234AEEB4|nr:AbrB/MazE/SpoVT family DNA-binding domain-containing protein [Leptospira sp. GIMC2001]WCL47779.1 AbrB/MazE/SpoVT family DNA-binding domain-containing protein [Leptospira sp. GIMC2001]
MIASIDKSGRMVIPKELRDELELIPDTELEIIRDGMDIRIRKRILPSLQVENKNGFMILNFDGELDIQSVLKEVRSDRIETFL